MQRVGWVPRAAEPWTRVRSVGPVGWSLDGPTFVGSAGAGVSEAPVAGVDNETSLGLCRIQKDLKDWEGEGSLK